MPLALPASRLNAPHQLPQGGGGEVAGQRGLPLSPGGPSVGLEAAAVRSKLTMAPAQFYAKQNNKNVLLVTKGHGSLKQLKAQELPSGPIRGSNLHYKKTLCL